jgi:hypothetical protein
MPKVCGRSDQAEDTEFLFNLWQLLRTSEMRGALTADQAQVEARTSGLKAALDRQIAITNRPNNAALAHTNRLLLDLMEGLGTPDGRRAALEGLKDIVVASDHLVHYPLERLANLLKEVGTVLASDEVFDAPTYGRHPFHARPATIQRTQPGESVAVASRPPPLKEST